MLETIGETREESEKKGGIMKKGENEKGEK